MGTDLLFGAFAVLAGAFSVLTPCVLVMLPAILAVTGGAGRRRVLGVVAGLELSFIGISLLAAAALDALGLPPRTQEYLAVAIIGALGVTLLVPALRTRFELLTSRAIGRMPGLTGRAAGGDGFRGGFVGGLGLGLVWAPCAGPFLAFVTTAANTGEFSTRSVLAAVGFGLGMLGPLLLVFRGGHVVVARLRRRFGTRHLDVGMGTAMLLTAAFIAIGGFTQLNREIARLDLNSTPIAGLERRFIEDRREDELSRVRAQEGSDGTGPPSERELELAGYPETAPGRLANLGPAPALTGINRTYNLADGQELTPEFLEGKVVVYDFWTYSCINCLRTLPYLRELYARYRDDGLVIVGVHAPEFAFEQDEGNVEDAIDDLDVTWPVATDPDLETWDAFHNRYWPAKYITDRSGTIRSVHYGEGAYDETESVIRELLEAEGDAAELPDPAPAVDYLRNTPETYLGLARLSLDQWRSSPAGSEQRTTRETAEFRLDPQGAAALEQDQFGLTGRWTLDAERATAAGDGSEIVIHYRARSVYLVLDPGDEPRARSTVVVRDLAPEGGGTRRVEVTGDRLYTLRESEETADATMRIEVPRGTSAYAFTFG